MYGCKKRTFVVETNDTDCIVSKVCIVSKPLGLTGFPMEKGKRFSIGCDMLGHYLLHLKRASMNIAGARKKENFKMDFERI